MPARQEGGSAYDVLPDGVVVADATGLVVAVNPAAERILSMPAADLVGRPLTEALPLVDPQGRDWWECTKPFGGLATRVRQPERLLSLAQPDQADRTLLVTASYVRDDAHRISSVVICFRDTAARSRSERSGAELVSVVAHELRSPLTSV